MIITVSFMLRIWVDNSVTGKGARASIRKYAALSSDDPAIKLPSQKTNTASGIDSNSAESPSVSSNHNDADTAANTSIAALLSEADKDNLTKGATDMLSIDLALPSSNQESTETVAFNVSSTRNRVGTWMGNTWIPPSGWRSYSTKELHCMFGSVTRPSTKTIFYIGDSTARRAANLLYLLLNETESQENILREALDDNKVLDLDSLIDKNETRVKWKLSYCFVDMIGGFRSYLKELKEYNARVAEAAAATKSFSTINDNITVTAESDRAQTLAKATQNNMPEAPWHQKDIGAIVFGIGAWDEGKKEVCGRYHKTDNYTKDLLSEMNDTFLVLDEYQRLSGHQLVWRTNGFFDDKARQSDRALMHTLNRAAMDWIEKNDNAGFTYVNYGEAIEPRSFGAQRVDGGHVAHYGFEVRFVLLQMLINHLVDLKVLSYPTSCHQRRTRRLR